MSFPRILFIVLALLIVLFFPLRALQILCLLYVLVLVCSFVYSRLVSRYVVLRRRDEILRAQRFEPLQISLIVENLSFLPVHYLCVLDRQNTFLGCEPGRFVVGLKPWERKILSYRIEPQSRGEYILGPALLRGSDPLGFFPWRKTEGEVQKLIVYPEILPLSLPHRSGLPAGNISVQDRVYEDVTRYRSLREYVPGDDLRRISWKASARTGRLYAIDYLPALYAPVLVLLNLNLEDYPLRYRHHRMERAASLAASLVIHFLTLRQEIGLLASAVFQDSSQIPVADIRGSHSFEHATAMLEMLARMNPNPRSMDFVRLLYESGLELPARTRLEVITPQLSPAQWGLLRKLREKGCTVEIFMVGSTPAKQSDQTNRGFPVYCVQDYGRELVYQ